MKTSSAKAKGRRAATELQRHLLEAFPELETEDIRVTPSGVGGVDILLSPKASKLIPFAFEVKNQERLNLWDALHQAARNSDKLHRPLLVFRKNREELHVAFALRDFLNILRKAS